MVYRCPGAMKLPQAAVAAAILHSAATARLASAQSFAIDPSGQTIWGLPPKASPVGNATTTTTNEAAENGIIFTITVIVGLLVSVLAAFAVFWLNQFCLDKKRSGAVVPVGGDSSAGAAEAGGHAVRLHVGQDNARAGQGGAGVMDSTRQETQVPQV